MDEIGFFQLENLAHTPTRFAFYDLRVKREELPPAVQALLKKATAADSETAFKALTAPSTDKQAPVVLVCETGKTSEALAGRLEKAGFANIYIIAGGVEGLLSEL